MLSDVDLVIGGRCKNRRKSKFCFRFRQQFYIISNKYIVTCEIRKAVELYVAISVKRIFSGKFCFEVRLHEIIVTM